METKLFSWTTKEFEHYEKGAGWYLTLGIIGFLLIAYEIYLHDYFAAITLLFIVGAVYFFSKQLPKEVQVTISDKGIKLNETFYPYSVLRRFWIVEHALSRHITLETTAYLNRYIVIQLEDQDSEGVSEILKKYLPESEPNQETLARKMARRLRF